MDRLNSKYKFSIITVCYQAEAIIERTINSVLNQSYQNFEYIIVDGGSVDNTLHIVGQYTVDSRVSVISEPDRGIYDAMNKGIGRASGDYVEFLNAGDTLIDGDVLQKVVEAVSEKESDIVYGNILYAYPDGKKAVRTYGQFCASRLYYLLGDCINHQAVFAKRDCFQNSKFDLDYAICADREWMIRQKLNHRTFRACGILVCEYSLDEDSASIRDKGKYFEEARRCVKQHLNYGIVLYDIVDRIRNGKVASRMLHWCYEAVFIRKK